MVELPGAGPVTLRSVIEAWPAEMLGSSFSDGGQTGVLVKLLSPSGPVPLHAHPTRDWARRHLGSPFGKTEAWILLDTPGDGREPAYAGIGFVPGCDRNWFFDAVRRHDNAALRSSLHRFPVAAGEVYVARAEVPHFLGPRISFIEVQEPSDHRDRRDSWFFRQRRRGGDDGAGLGLGAGHDRLPCTGSAAAALSRARQQPRVLRTGHSPRSPSRSREVRLFHETAPVLQRQRARSRTRSRSATGGSRSRSWWRARGGVGDFGVRRCGRGSRWRRRPAWRCGCSARPRRCGSCAASGLGRAVSRRRFR